MTVISTLPPAVRTYVRDFDARSRRLGLVRALGLALAVFVGWMIVCCLSDRLVQLESPIRVGLLAAGVVAAVAIVWRPARAIIRRDVDWLGAADRIERRDPQFGERLLTVASRVLGPAEHRGSDDMLRELLRDVDRRAAAGAPARLLPISAALWPWVTLAMLATIFAGIARVPPLEMRALAARFLLPTADLPAVTTTKLNVLTGARDVMQSDPLRIEADVARLDPRQLVSLFISGVDDDGSERWSRSTMDAGAAGRFAFAMTSVDRDFRYYVTAGDARSRTFAIRVRRPPAVERFSIRYEYPAYTGRPPVTVTNADGLVEAPIGTRAALTITATEPLDSALMTMGSAKILMEPAGSQDAAAHDDSKRQRHTTFEVKRDTRYAIDLISDRQVPGTGPARMQVRAMPDGRPLVRLSQSGQNLRLHPRELLPLSLQALDDYGIARLAVVAQVNAAPPTELPLEIAGDPRRQERDYTLDLATMKLAIGDVVSLSLAATDRAGQRSATPTVQVLVSPRSVDLATYQRIAELNTAATQAAALNEQLTAASAALEEADREAPARSLAFFAANYRANRRLPAAAETATLMRQALFRALVNGAARPELATTLAGWIDQAQVQSWLAEDLFRRADAPAGMGNESRGMLTRSLETTRVLRDEIRTIAAGERAAAVLADRENLLAAQKRSQATSQPTEAATRLAQTLQRAQEDIAAGAREIGIDPSASDLEAQLGAKVYASIALERSKRPLDYVAVAREWAQALQRDRTQPVVLDERLAAGATAEAVRSDSNLLRACDLELAGRAAARLETLAQADPTARTLPATIFNDYAAALTALQREHELSRRTAAMPATRPASTQPVDNELLKVRELATAARVSMQHWADDSEDLPGGDARLPTATRSALGGDAAALALRASVETASRNYKTAAELDAKFASQLAANPTQPDKGPRRPHEEIAQSVRRAETLDQLGADQQRIASETEGEEAPEALAGRQRDVAEAIARVDGSPAPVSPSAEAPLGEVAPADSGDPNWRGRATAAVLSAQESLAAMPQQIADAQAAMGPWRDAVTRAEQAKKDASAMPDQQRQPAAERAALQAARDAADAAQRFEDRRRVIGPSAAEQLVSSLEPFAPETTGAADVISHGLLPALHRLDEAAKAGDAGGFNRVGDEVRQSVGAVQQELARAQESLTARDPLVVAKRFASAAAEYLTKSPPDVQAAQMRQRDTMSALSRAWDRAIHNAASLRMSSLPALQAIYGPPDSRLARAASTAQSDPTANRNLSPELRPAASNDLQQRGADGDPAGFEEPLRLYFETLSKGGAAEAGK